jgi:hypothetical protein
MVVISIILSFRFFSAFSRTSLTRLNEGNICGILPSSFK